MQKTKRSAHFLAGDARNSEHRQDAITRAIREAHERDDLRADYFGMTKGINRADLGSRRWRWDDAAPGTAKRSPLFDLLTDVRCVKAAGASEAEACAAIDRLHTLAHAEFRRDALPDTRALDLEETEAQAAADVAVRRYCTEPVGSAREATLMAEAIRALNAHVAAAARLRDRMRQDRVIVLHTQGPRLVTERGR